MKRIALAVALAAVGCGEDCPPTLADDVAHLFNASAEGVACAEPLTRSDEPGRALCAWECIAIGDRTARSLYLDFVAAPVWHLESISVEYSRADECG